MSSNGGGRWASRFPVYQIDFTAVASGKRIATTKRRIRWRFGFSNREALEAGETGTNCRGEEHDITIIWSITSGKRHILSDGHEVHYSMNRSSLLEYSWTMRGNHVLKVVANASAPLSNQPGIRQYDLLIDGQSYFQMPKVYELGIKGPGGRVPGVNMAPSHSVAPPLGQSYDQHGGRHEVAPSTREQEEADLQKAISASIEESRAHLQRNIQAKNDPGASSPEAAPVADSSASPASPASGGDLLDVGGAPPPVPTPAPAYNNALVPSEAPAFATAAPPPPPVGVPPPPTDAFAASSPPPPSPHQLGGGFTPGVAPPPPQQQQQQFVSPQPPPPPADDPFAPQPVVPIQAPTPSVSDVHRDILGAYGSSEGELPALPASTTETSADGAPTDGAALESSSELPNAEDPPQQSESNPQLVVDTSASGDAEEKKGVENPFASLVNIDDINSPVEKPTNANPFAKEEEGKREEKQKRSKPKPPMAAGWGGPQPTLGQMKATKVNETSNALVIKPPAPAAPAYDPNVPQPGMGMGMGMAAQDPTAASGMAGPPPLPTGFGVGAQQQQQAYGTPQYGGPPQQQGAAFGAPPPTQQAPYQQQQPPPPPPQPGYGNYSY